jgi:integrase
VLRPSTFVRPCEPTLRDRPPTGDAWLHEVKFDGYRFQIHKLGGKVWLFTRNGHDWTERLPLLAAELAALPACIIDAELVATDNTGKINFRTLRHTLSKRHEGGRDEPRQPATPVVPQVAAENAQPNSTLNRKWHPEKTLELSIKGKGDRVRTVYFSPHACHWIREYLAARGPDCGSAPPIDPYRHPSATRRSSPPLLRYAPQLRP